MDFNIGFISNAGPSWVPEYLQGFMEIQVFGIPNWKWFLLTMGFIFLYFFRFLLLWIIKNVKKAQNYFPKKSLSNLFLNLEFEKGLSWVLISILALILTDSSQLTPQLDLYIKGLIKLFLSVNVIRLCYLLAEAIGLYIQEWAKTTETQLDDQLAPFANKTLKVLVIIIGCLIVLQNFGVNVTALLAGLGIGGVALAFAAQDTVANVFGTITILMDNPFKLGDWIKIGDTEGIVEEVGFRSTRIRTFYNSVVTLPNSVVAKEKIDNLTKRNGWVRFRHTLGFTYDAKPDTLNKFADTLKQLLLSDSSIDKNRIVIHFNSFGDFSLNVLVNFHYKLREEENEVMRTNYYLDMIYNLSQKSQLDFAFPTRTMIMQNK